MMRLVEEGRREKGKGEGTNLPLSCGCRRKECESRKDEERRVLGTQLGCECCGKRNGEYQRGGESRRNDARQPSDATSNSPATNVTSDTKKTTSHSNQSTFSS